MYLVSRTESFAKLFFIVSFTGLFMYVALAFYSFHTAYSTVSHIAGYPEQIGRFPDFSIERFTRSLKYILVWTLNDSYTLQGGQAPFIDNNCPDLNCYITTNKSLLDGNYINFDAIVFNLSIIYKWKRILLPSNRSSHQKYVFYSNIPSDNYPICNLIVNNYFNWTWSYKFGSDIFSPFIEVLNLKGDVVAPKTDVDWKNNVQPVVTELIDNIDNVITKSKAVIWIMNDCTKRQNSIYFIKKLRKALKDVSLVLDIYGCENLECPDGGCLAAVQRDYYFYLVYENSMAEDYVTDEVLKAYDNDAVPILVGGSDFTKFLPEKSYIGFKDHTIEMLTALLVYAIKNPSEYREYFNWKKLYTVQKVDENLGYCKLCTLLNDKTKFNSYSTYENFRRWWYTGSFKEKCLPKGAERYGEVMTIVNVTTTIRY